MASDLLANGTAHSPANTRERSRQQLATPVNRLLLSAAHAAATCDVSLRSWSRLDSAGLIPSAIRLGGRKVWRAEELGEWVRAGCLPRSSWRWKPNGRNSNAD